MKHLKVFTAKWCGPCKQLAPLLEGLDILVVKIDIEDEPNIAEIHGIRGVPTLKLYDDYTYKGSRYGAQTKEQLLEFIK